jgi:hypothetical protein
VARQVVVRVSCDVCEAPEASEVEFAVDRSAFSIDLCPEHRGQFTNALSPFVSRARTARVRAASGGTSAGASKKPNRRNPSETEAVRAWARETGQQISSRGRIPAHIQAAYEARPRG